MKLLNVKDVANKLKSTTGTVYAWVSMHKIPSWCVIKHSKRLLFDEEAIDKWLNNSRLAPLPSVP